VQLDQSRIAIRQRSWLENLDLSLHVIRQHAGPLVLAALMGCLPFALLNGWLLRRMLDLEIDPGEVTSFMWFYVWLMVAELPLATSLITLYLGQALFSERPTARQVATDFARSLPQLLLLQGLVRALLVLPVITWLLLFAVWPYLNEIILLERNPLRSGRRGQISTTKRSSALHSSTSGELLLQSLASAMLGALLVVALWRGLGFVLGTFVGSWGLSQMQYKVLLPIAAWTVASFFAVVRFLSYLDLRIRREGWEVELNLRAERARLTRQLA
jgi:hypothetical protein